MVTDDLTHKNMWLLAFAFAIFVYLVAFVLFLLNKAVFIISNCRVEHRRPVERHVLTLGRDPARDLNGAGVRLCVCVSDLWLSCRLRLQPAASWTTRQWES